MAGYTVWIKSRGRGLRSTTLPALMTLAAIKGQARHWLEYGSEVTVKSPSGKVINFTVR